MSLRSWWRWPDEWPPEPGPEPERNPPVTRDVPVEDQRARLAMIAALRAAQHALGALSGRPDRFEHVGRVQWLIEGLEHGEDDEGWYAAGLRDGMETATGEPCDRQMLAVTDPGTYRAIYERGRADAPPSPVDLSPFESVLVELQTRQNATGGAAQNSYANAASLVRSALARYVAVED